MAGNYEMIKYADIQYSEDCAIFEVICLSASEGRVFPDEWLQSTDHNFLSQFDNVVMHQFQ